MQPDYKRGVITTLGAYSLWGFLPIYWKSFTNVSSYEILAERIVWSFVFMIVVIALTGRTATVLSESREIISVPKKLLLMIATGILISVNWLLFIVAVNDGKIVETSLGYYINPLVSILLGVYYFKESLNIWQKCSFALAGIGVLIMTIKVGGLPWISLALALTFGLYGLLKKMMQVSVVTGLTLETLVSMPLALAYILHLYANGVSSWQVADNFSLVLVCLSGIVTATPLLLFASGAKLLPLNIVGFLQYLSPTISLLIGVFMYHEVFGSTQLWAFGFIWLALALFTLSQNKRFYMFLEKLLLKKQ